MRQVMRTLGAAVCSCLLLAPAAEASAPLFTWTGKAPEAGWSDPGNWAGEAPAPGASVNLEFPRLLGCAPGTCHTSTNDLSGLNVESISIDDGESYRLEGNEITLGAGGLTASPASESSGTATDVIDLPIELGGEQTWSLAGRGGSLAELSGLLLGGELSGPAALTVDMSHEAALFLQDKAELGSATLVGANTAGAGVLNGVVDLLGAELNNANGHPVKLEHISAVGNGELGALTLSHAELNIGTGEDPAGLIVASSGAFDAASHVIFQIHGAGTSAGKSYSQLQSQSTLALGGSSLGVAVGPTKAGASCPSLSVGDQYTLIESTGAISGSFGNAPEGAEIPIEYRPTCTAQSALRLQIAYRRDAGIQSVTATVVGAHPVEPAKPLPLRLEPQMPIPPSTNAPPGATAVSAKAKVSLAARRVVVRTRVRAVVRLACAGTGTCTGKLALTAKSSPHKGKSGKAGARRKTETVGRASFSVRAGETAAIKLTLNSIGRALLSAAHGNLLAQLTLLELEPEVLKPITARVRLALEPGVRKSRR